MKRLVCTALLATVMSVASVNAMADDKMKTDHKAMHHHKHHMVSNHEMPGEKMMRPTTKDTQVLQQSLRDSGFYKAPVTGVWNDTTENALAAYQKANGLQVTGTLNESTVKQLGLHTTAKEKIAGTSHEMTPRHKMHHKGVKMAHKQGSDEKVPVVMDKKAK